MVKMHPKPRTFYLSSIIFASMALFGTGEILTFVLPPILVWIISLYLAYKYGKNSGKREVLERIRDD
jgi:hypothetical protein